MRANLVALVSALVACVACGGASSPPVAAPGGAAGGGGAAERCLAVAGARHPARPGEPATITVSHVLVPYASAKRAPATVTRSREQACVRAEEARAKLEGGTSFGDVVKAYSEEPGAASREGSIGPVTRAMVVPAFADAAFELQPGEVSQVVESDFGFHVILRAQ